MSNIGKAAEVIARHNADGECSEPECLAQDLADAGLLMPDLPEQSWPKVWETKGFLVTATDDAGETIGLAENEGDGEAGLGWLMDRALARDLGLALLAAAQHAEKEQA